MWPVLKRLGLARSFLGGPAPDYEDSPLVDERLAGGHPSVGQRRYGLPLAGRDVETLGCRGFNNRQVWQLGIGFEKDFDKLIEIR